MADYRNRSLLQQAQDRLTDVKQFLTSEPTGFSFPPFDELPRIANQPRGCLWGFFDKNGVRDELGTLNLLTPALVRQASKEIQTGVHVQLDACLNDFVEFPGFGRRKFEHTVLDAKTKPKGAHFGFDDEIRMNTQSGSQWDSLKHFAHQASGLYYNGLSHEAARDSNANGTHAWCERGGIVGRGVLVDWYALCVRTKGSVPSAVSRHEIPAKELEACLRAQGTEVRQGDVLIIRSGYKKWHDGAGTEERRRGTQKNSIAIGLQANEETVRWLYGKHFAAVAGDTVAFEAWPPWFGEVYGCLHEWCLAQWGTPIGELWDLERLSEVCQKLGRWSFFLTSAPLHVRGGVGSPPGVVAIF